MPPSLKGGCTGYRRTAAIGHITSQAGDLLSYFGFLGYFFRSTMPELPSSHTNNLAKWAALHRFEGDCPAHLGVTSDMALAIK